MYIQNNNFFQLCNVDHGYSMSRSFWGKKRGILLLLSFIVVLQGCVGANTFPTMARAGDTISVMVGGSETARTGTVDVTLTDFDSVPWDLQSLGLVRSVFNLRADGRAHGMHYSSNFFDVDGAWNEGHEPTQTVLMFDIPQGAAVGAAILDINVNTTDDSSGISSPYSIPIEVLAGMGGSSDFLRQNFSGGAQPVDFASLEAAPYVKIGFGAGGFGPGNDTIGAVSLVIDFDELVVDGDDLNVVSSVSTTRGTASDPDAPFGDKQRMISWRQDGLQLYINIIAPQGIKTRYLQLYVVHPRTVVGNPAFNVASATFYDIDGSVDNGITGIPVLSYNP